MENGHYLRIMLNSTTDSNKILFSNHHVSHALTSTIYEKYNKHNNNKDKLIVVADGVGVENIVYIYND